MATWKATSDCLNDPPLPPPLPENPRDVAFSACIGSIREPCNAGAKPNRIPVNTATAMLNRSTRPSGARFKGIGELPLDAHLGRMELHH